MRPVVCANCGTKNPRGSKYCNECGHELIPTSTQLCPNCEASNPINRLYCDNCGARLAAAEEPTPPEEESGDDAAGAGSPEPFSLPSRPPGQTGRLELDRELPAWLRTGEEGEGDRALESDPSEEGEPAESSERAPEEEAGEHRPADDLPGWLLAEEEPSDIFDSDKTTDELFLALQQESGGGSGDAEEDEGAASEGERSVPPEKGKAEEALGEWLSAEGGAASDEDAYDEAEGEGLAGWLEELEQEDDLAPAEEGLSDWLAELEDEGDEDDDEREAAEPAGEGVADRLADLEKETGQEPSEEEPAGEGVADWLADLERQAEEEESTTPEFSDWLADLEEAAAVETGVVSDQDEEGAAGRSEEELIPWEMEAAGEKPSEMEAAVDADETVTAPEEAEAGVPDWLADLEAEADAEAEAIVGEEEPLPWEKAGDEEARGEDVEADVPDWLADLEAEAAAGAEMVEGDDEPLPWEPEEGGPEESELTEAGPQDAAGESIVDGVPGWLSDLGEETDVAEGTFGEEEIPPAVEEGAFSEEAAADWLSRLHDEPEEAALSEEAAAGPEAGEAAPQDSEAEIPTWLAHLDSEAIRTARGDEVTPEEPGEADEIGEEEAGDVPDWLAAIDAGEEEAWATSDEMPEVDELPDWLAEVDAPADEEAVAAPEEFPPEETPDWLANEEQVLPEGAESKEEEAAPADDVPDWLEEMAPDARTGAEEQAAQQEEEDLAAILGAMDADDEMPDWLLEGEPSEEVAPAEEEDFVAAADEAAVESGAAGLEEVAGDEKAFLDWSEVPAAQEGPEGPPEEGEEVSSVEEVSPEGEVDFAGAAEEAVEFGESFDLTVEMEDSDRVSDEDLPDWLGDVMAGVDEEMPPAREEAPAAEGPTPDLENVPQQLAGTELPEWLEDSLSEEAAPAERTPLEEMPTWIQAAGQAFLGETEEEAATAGPEGEGEIEEVDLDLETSGEWQDLLEELPPPEPTAEEVREAEIPEWVQALKPQELTGEGPETPEPRTPAETSGPLAGLHGVIGVEPAVTEPHSASPMAPLAPSKEQEQQAALLRQLTRSEESEAVVVATAPEMTGSPWVRALLALLLVAAVLVGLFVPGLLETTPSATGVAEAQEAVAAAAGRPVLVAFDYTPATAAVLDGQANLLLEALAEGDSPVLFISQSPAGLALAQQAVDQVDGLESQRLGYLPGEAIGLRRLTACLETGSACRPISGLGQEEAAGISATDLGLIIVFAADRDGLINWIEQVDARTSVPMVVGVTQALAPVAGPYLASGQLEGLLAGFPATVAFQAETGDVSNRTQAELDMLTLAQWLVITLFVVGNVVYLAVGSRRSRAARGEVS